jgi:hypothetical protein
MKIFMTGGTGFVGRTLSRRLTDIGHTITILTRSKSKVTDTELVRFVEGDPKTPGDWQRAVPGHDAVVNLAGTSVFAKWTPEYKQSLRDSRILTTRHIVEALPEDASAVTLISTSGLGYFGFTGAEKLAEDAPPGDDFLARLAQDWEAEAKKAETKGARVVMARFGVVFGRGGGALEQMTLPFKFFMGGPVGSGRQWVSWIHMEDLCNAIVFCLDNTEIHGPVNFSAPEPVTNKELSQTIGKVLSRPSFIPAPAFMIKLVLGEFGSVILEGQRAIPKALLDHGFEFTYPDVESALRDILTDS